MNVSSLRAFRLKTIAGERVINPGETFEIDEQRAKPFIEQGLIEPIKEKSPSFRFTQEEIIQYCGDGSICDRCQPLSGETGKALTTIYFWSEKTGKFLDPTIPKKDLTIFEFVQKARSLREEKFQLDKK